MSIHKPRDIIFLPVEKLRFQLQELGYPNKFSWLDRKLKLTESGADLSPEELFFVDSGFFHQDSSIYYFALSFPKMKTKGVLELSKIEFDDLLSTDYKSKFDFKIIEFSEEVPSIEIKRQYGMRKISQAEFNPESHVLRVGFPDFPSCPYGNYFEFLGYDVKEKEYIRFAKSILKSDKLTTEKHQN